MGWSLGYDSTWCRWIGYGVPAYCDHPKCNAEIDRGLAHVCSGEPYGGDRGCGLYFCSAHLYLDPVRGFRCLRCQQSKPPYKRIKPEHPRWIKHLLTDSSWAQWRAENPERVKEMRGAA